MSVDDVVEKYIDARGGREALASLRSLKMVGDLKTGDATVPLTIVIEKPQHVRIEYDLVGKKLIQASDGKTAWQLNTTFPDARPVTIDMKEAGPINHWADVDGPLVDFKEKGHQVEYLGKEDLVGGKAHKLQVRLISGEVWQIYLSADTYHEVKRTNKRTIKYKIRDVSTYFTNFREVEGVMLPTEIEGLGLDGTPFTIIFDRFEANTETAPEMFGLPSHIHGSRQVPEFIELTDLEPLKDRFNQEAGLVRFLALLSPN
jgi:hypothetical protein